MLPGRAGRGSAPYVRAGRPAAGCRARERDDRHDRDRHHEPRVCHQCTRFRATPVHAPRLTSGGGSAASGDGERRGRGVAPGGATGTEAGSRPASSAGGDAARYVLPGTRRRRRGSNSATDAASPRPIARSRRHVGERRRCGDRGRLVRVAARHRGRDVDRRHAAGGGSAADAASVGAGDAQRPPRRAGADRARRSVEPPPEATRSSASRAPPRRRRPARRGERRPGRRANRRARADAVSGDAETVGDAKAEASRTRPRIAKADGESACQHDAEQHDTA